MADLKTLVEREMDRAGEPAFAFEDLDGLRVRRHRRKQITAAVVGLGAVLILALVGTSIYRSASVPATPPEEPTVDLGIFEPLAGKVVYYEDASLWGIDPNAPSPVSTLVRLDVGGTAAAARFASFTIPLGWSSDGTELLFLREDPTDDTFPYDRHLHILHADGTETLVTTEPVDGAAISPDGTRVVFASVADDGLYVVDAEGGRPVRVAEGEEPTFSPDGTQIAYLGLPRSDCCVPAEREHVWVANADGTDAHEILVDEPALDKGVFELQWSPAGERIAMGNSLGRHVAIYTFAPDGSDFTKVIDGGLNPFWSPDGSEIAYGSLSIADADGSNVRTFDVGSSGPWHPGAVGAEGKDVLEPTPSRFVAGWTAIDYADTFLGDDTTPYQTMTIRAGEDGVLHVTVDDDSACVPDATAQTMTGTGRLEDSTTLVVPAPELTCAEGSVEASDRVDVLDDYTLVFDPDTDRLYDSLGIVWTRGEPAESWIGRSTQAEVDGPGTYSILYREVAFRTAEPWNVHMEAYIDPRTFFLVGPGDAEMTMLVNPLPPEAPCGTRVPPSAEELVQAIRSNPDLETTEPVIEAVGGIDALRMDVVAAPGASFGPCTLADEVDVVSVPGLPWANVGPGELGRLYLLDLPGGSARTLAIWITAPSATAFELAVDSAAPILDSFEFQAP